MPPLVLAYLIVLVVGLPLAWVKGGEPERLAAIALFVAWMAALVVQDVTVGKTFVGEALTDVALLGFFGWLALKRDRWWVLAALALMILVLIVHVATVFLPDLTQRGDRVARMGLGMVLTLTMIVGVAERWLSGERPRSRFGFGPAIP